MQDIFLGCESECLRCNYCDGKCKFKCHIKWKCNQRLMTGFGVECGAESLLLREVGAMEKEISSHSPFSATHCLRNATRTIGTRKIIVHFDVLAKKRSHENFSYAKAFLTIFHHKRLIRMKIRWTAQRTGGHVTLEQIYCRQSLAFP